MRQDKQQIAYEMRLRPAWRLDSALVKQAQPRKLFVLGEDGKLVAIDPPINSKQGYKWR